jgi:hypothetical protein
MLKGRSPLPHFVGSFFCYSAVVHSVEGSSLAQVLERKTVNLEANSSTLLGRVYFYVLLILRPTVRRRVYFYVLLEDSHVLRMDFIAFFCTYV